MLRKYMWLLDWNYEEMIVIAFIVEILACHLLLLCSIAVNEFYGA
jgi:hypothetical protein